jgi:hypothetical protein
MSFVFLAAALALQTGAAQPAATAPQGQPTQGQPTQGQVARIRPSPELVNAYQAWGKCMDDGVKAVPATETPEAAGPRVAAACATQLNAVATIGERWISGLRLPAAQSAQLRQKLKTETTGVEQRVIARLRQMRAPARPAVQGR